MKSFCYQSARVIAVATVLTMSACQYAPGMRLTDGFADPKAAPQPRDALLIPIDAEVVQDLRVGVLPVEKVVDKELGALADYRIGPGDALSIVVWEHPELSTMLQPNLQNSPTEYVVNSEGFIFFPYAGRVAVAGKTTEALRAELSRSLAPYVRNPQVGVRVSQFRSKRIVVAGEVNAPQVVPLTDRPLTLIEAINLSGGGKEIADLSNVALTRGGRTRYVNLLSYYRDGRGEIFLQDGDRVYVESRRARKVFLLGEVQQPKAVVMESGGMSLAEALGESGGLDKENADASRIYVIRGNMDEVLAFQLNASSPDSLLLATMFPLAPNDVIFVATAESAVFNKLLRQLTPTITALWQTNTLVRTNR